MGNMTTGTEIVKSVYFVKILRIPFFIEHHQSVAASTNNFTDELSDETKKWLKILGKFCKS